MGQWMGEGRETRGLPRSSRQQWARLVSSRVGRSGHIQDVLKLVPTAFADRLDRRYERK